MILTEKTNHGPDAIWKSRMWMYFLWELLSNEKVNQDEYGRLCDQSDTFRGKNLTKKK